MGSVALNVCAPSVHLRESSSRDVAYFRFSDYSVLNERESDKECR